MTHAADLFKRQRQLTLEDINKLDAEGIHRTTDNHKRKRLRSADTTTLLVPPSRRSTLGDRSFFVAAPRAWNALPGALRSATSLSTFRRDLKTVFSGGRCG